MRPRRLASPFLTTIALACTHPQEAPPNNPPPPTPNPPAPTESVSAAPSAAAPASATASASASASASSGLQFDGYTSCYRVVNGEKKYEKCTDDVLPKAAAGDPTYKKYDGCHKPPNGALVACPPSGPTLVLSDKKSVADGNKQIMFDDGSLSCMQHVNVECPKGVFCNPPPPHAVPCPAELLPKLAPGVKPTKQEKNECKLGDVVVSCAK